MSKMLILLILIGISCNASAKDFMNYECTQDCSGHQAGYEWAEERGISSEDECGGNSNSFIEGCLAYVESVSGELQEEENQEY